MFDGLGGFGAMHLSRIFLGSSEIPRWFLSQWTPRTSPVGVPPWAFASYANGKEEDTLQEVCFSGIPGFLEVFSSFSKVKMMSVDECFSTQLDYRSNITQELLLKPRKKKSK